MVKQESIVREVSFRGNGLPPVTAKLSKGQAWVSINGVCHEDIPVDRVVVFCRRVNRAAQEAEKMLQEEEVHHAD